MKIKVCGMNNQDNLKAISAFKPNYFGFIFYDKSPRYISLKHLPSYNEIPKIGVFVNAEIDFIIEKQEHFNLQGIQLHGNEDYDTVLQLKSKLPNSIKIFKAISIQNFDDFKNINKYNSMVDVIILDTKTPLKGGSGQQFDWDLLDHYSAKLPFLLSGGIGVNDAEKILFLYEKYPKMLGVDINSKFEIEPGLKNINKVKKFIEILKYKNGTN